MVRTILPATCPASLSRVGGRRVLEREDAFEDHPEASVLDEPGDGVEVVARRREAELTQPLRSLERDGLVERTVYPTVPPRVEYGLTELGLGVGHLTSAVAEWSVEHVAEIAAARASFDARASEAPQPIRS
jgi:hypothetical protein